MVRLEFGDCEIDTLMADVVDICANKFAEFIKRCRLHRLDWLDELGED